MSDVWSSIFAMAGILLIHVVVTNNRLNHIETYLSKKSER